MGVRVWPDESVSSHFINVMWHLSSSSWYPYQIHYTGQSDIVFIPLPSVMCAWFISQKCMNGGERINDIVCVNYREIFWIWHSDDHASWYILIIKPTRCTNFSNLFWNKTLHVSDSSSVHHQEFFTVHTAMVYVIQVLLTAGKWDQDGTILILLTSCQQNLHDIYHCCVYSEKLLMMDRGTVWNM